MEDIHIDETVAGRIKIDFSHSYLQRKGITMQLVIVDIDVARKLVGEVLLEVGFTEDEIDNSSFVIDAKFDATVITFNVYTPHSLTHHPYILDGEEYDVPEEPVGFVILHDDFLGGVCECEGCNHVRRFYETMNIAVNDSNVPFTGETFEFGAYETTDQEEEDDEDEEKLYYLEDVPPAPKPSALQPMSNIDSEERNVDFNIFDEVVNSQEQQNMLRNVKPYKPGHAIFLFRDIEHVISVSRVLVEVLDELTSLYSYNNRYYLVYDLEWFGNQGYKEDILKDISAVNVEHGGLRSKTTKYYLSEYGKEIINGHALSTLLTHFG